MILELIALVVLSTAWCAWRILWRALSEMAQQEPRLEHPVSFIMVEFYQGPIGPERQRASCRPSQLARKPE
jgi:hypothetical protein